MKINFHLTIIGNFEKYRWPRCEKILSYFTEIETKELESIIIKEKNINNLKILLANEATKLLHGKNASIKAEQTAMDTFKKGGVGSDLPEIKINIDKIRKGIKILDFISENKILSSKSEARRVIANKGIKMNDVVIEDEKREIQLKDFKKDIIKLSYGKKKHYLIKID